MLKFKDKSKMKRYIEMELEHKITNEQFQDCLDYLNEFHDYMTETKNDLNIVEGASLELEIGDEDIEVWVEYTDVIEKDNRYTVVDFVYDKPTLEEIFNI